MDSSTHQAIELSSLTPTAHILEYICAASALRTASHTVYKLSYCYFYRHVCMVNVSFGLGVCECCMLCGISDAAELQLGSHDSNGVILGVIN